MLQLSPVGDCREARMSRLLACLTQVISDVVFGEPDGSAADSDSVVGDLSGFDELVDAGRADVQSPGDVFDGEQHDWVAFDSGVDREWTKKCRQLEVRELPAVKRIGGLSP